MVKILYFLIVAVVAYFIGTINFAKIVAWHARRKDITKIGSKNPGTMNMLRSFGFWLALTTFLLEVVKAGAVCLVTRIVFLHCGLPDLAEVSYFVAGFFLILGYDFPVWSKFKGGKGVACMAGIFLFSNLWYVALGWFAICFILLVALDYGCVVSFTYIGGLTIAYTIYIWLVGIPYAWAITAIIWFLLALMVFKHRKNIQRLLNHTENKVGFKSKLAKIFSKKKGEEVIDEAMTDPSAEKEIIIEENEDKEKTE